MDNTNSKRLLILDESEGLLWILKVFFEGKGYTVKSIDDADKIYSAIESFRPDVLFMDVFLNSDDGRVICQNLKSRSDTKHVGILLTSTSPKVIENCKMYQADDCIEKPFDLNLLGQKISSILS